MENNHNQNINNLLIDIKDKIGNPVNVFVVRATIESFGIREVDVSEDYGQNTIKNLAEFIYDQIKSDHPELLKNSKEKEELTKDRTISISNYLFIRTKLFLQYFPLGLFHLFPIFLQIVAIIIFGYSLWTYLEFNQIQSTAVVFGVIGGLVITGGFVQVIGRQASFYWYHDDLMMTKKTIFDIILLAIKSMFVSFIVVLVLNFFIPLYPISFFLVVFTYSFLIGLLLLFLAPMHTIKQRWVVSVAILIGTAIAILLKTETVLHIYYTHWIGIIIAVLIMAAYLLFFFRKIKITSSKSRTINDGMVIIHKNYQYFIYGVLIYVFIFTDRLVAWSTSTENLPFIIFYELNYEVGMDIAILIFFLLAGVLEYNIAAFTKFLNIFLKSTPYDKFEDFNRKFFNMYKRQVGLLLLASIVLLGFIYMLVTQAWGYDSYFDEPLNEISFNVAILGSLGYVFFTWGVLNTLYLFSMNQPNKPVEAIIIALLVNLIIGLLASRLISYEYSAIGMIVGSLVFALITLKENLKFFKNLDYYYNASY